MDKKYVLILLTLIVIIGAILRFYNLGAESFRVDEATTAMAIKMHSFKELLNNTFLHGQILPEYFSSNLDFPVYYLLLKLWTGVFGIGELALRMMSAIFGIFAIILVYLLAKEMFNEKAGLISALIFSLSVIFIERSQEARLYSFLVFIVLLITYFLFKYIGTKKNKYFWIFFSCNIIGIYTSPSFIFFFVFEISYLLYKSSLEFVKNKKMSIEKIHTSFIFLLLVYLPLLLRIIYPKIDGLRLSGSMSLVKLGKIFLSYNTWFYPSSELANKINNMQFNLLTINELLAIILVISLVALLFGFFLMGLFRRMTKEKEYVIFLLFILVVPFAFFFVLLYRVISIFPSNVYIIYTIPAYFILVSYPISLLKNKKIILIALIILLLSITPLASYFLSPHYPQYREAALYLQENTKKDDTILVNLDSVKVSLDYYTLKSINVQGVFSLEEVEKLAKNKKSVWLVLSTKYADEKGLIKSYFDHKYRLQETKRWYDITLYHYII